MKSLHALLSNLVDYAGLFPPASLDMASTVQNYSAYLKGEYSWVLGCLIIPVSRLEEFESAAQQFFHQNANALPWRLSVLGGSNLENDIIKIMEFNKRHSASSQNGAVMIDAIEIKAMSHREIRQVKDIIPKGIEVYFEIPVAKDPTELISIIASVGARAKVRTGGITPELFPSPADLVQFLKVCVNRQVAFKATAGLHHPIRSTYRLTYAPSSSSAMMYGFLNVFLAAAFLQSGMAITETTQLLEEQSAGAFRFADDQISWRTHSLSLNQLLHARQHFAIAFGSCSFEEPINDLKALHLL